MPTPLLNAYAENLPRLSAEESLLAAERVAVGTGSFRDKHTGRRIASGWERQADRKPVVVRPRSREMYQAQMAGLGIGVKTEPVKRDG